MSRVRLTGPYRYLIYVTPDYAIVEGLNGLDLGTGPLQEGRYESVDHSGPLFRFTRVGTYKKSKKKINGK